MKCQCWVVNGFPLTPHGLRRTDSAAPCLEGGLVVDYIGIAAELKNALKTYTDAKGKGTPTLKAEKALDRRARPLVRPDERCAGNGDETMKSSLRREKVKWARRGGHALPGLGSERDAPATNCGETPQPLSGEAIGLVLKQAFWSVEKRRAGRNTSITSTARASAAAGLRRVCGGIPPSRRAAGGCSGSRGVFGGCSFSCSGSPRRRNGR